ncbi:TatD family hydrolase [Actinokineospora diospyrosa]|uniref:TatD DNase family protein n=1 Tax=Actinokineospora diospyrosa TaxID=103728 RepID=A0ABT1I5S6_9PSEU|nr:TatD family hydrolase [Actinokineospora diospyrosa]MCP2267936.1 TatD DNase family protein [Actinokineospora diospyrosa]
MSLYPDLPRLDCHAHIAPDVTTEQIRRLGDCVVYAVSRTLDEGYAALRRRNDDRLIWGWGAHPAVPEALDTFTPERAATLTSRLPLVGEIGLDRRGSKERQTAVFAAALQAAQGQPVLISVHSTGRTAAVIDTVRTHTHPGLVLHWFLGTPTEVAAAVAAGCYFSVNAAMPMDVLHHIPQDRMLPETDFPAGRRTGGGRMPGDTEPVEVKVAGLLGVTPSHVRRMFWKNLRDISVASGALERYPEFVADILLTL